MMKSEIIDVTFIMASLVTIVLRIKTHFATEVYVHGPRLNTRKMRAEVQKAFVYLVVPKGIIISINLFG